jgi:hypothetical protein
MKNIILTCLALCAITNFTGCQTVGINLDEAYWDRHDHCDKYVQREWEIQHQGNMTNDEARKVNRHLQSLPKKY